MFECDMVKGLADDYEAPGLKLDLIKGDAAEQDEAINQASA
jgi:hypothetical protein